MAWHMRKKLTTNSKITQFMSFYIIFQASPLFVNWFFFSFDLSVPEPKLSF